MSTSDEAVGGDGPDPPGTDASNPSGDGDDRSRPTSDDSESVALNVSDRRILRYLDGSTADYPALIAGNTGLHVGYVERRIETLSTSGLVEPVSGEVIYRITRLGREALGNG